MIGQLVCFAPLAGLLAVALGLAAWSFFHGARDRAADRRRRQQRIARLEDRYETSRRLRPFREQLEGGASLDQAADFFPMPYRDQANA